MRIVAILLALIPPLWAEGVWAGDCAYNSYYLNFQSEVDALAATGCDSVSVDLNVYGSDVTNLDGLANITSVGRNLSIYTSNLTNIDGLVNLASVGGNLQISDTNVLTDIDGLVSLKSVGALDIFRNDALKNIDGLVNLASVGGNLQIARAKSGNLVFQ